MINVVIVAGGKQTRFKELSVFPKVLLPTVSKPSILNETIDQLIGLQDVSVHLVMNNAYKNATEDYLDVNGLSDKVNLIISTNTFGSFNTLRDVKKDLPNSNVLFIWSDLIVSDLKRIIDACNRSSSDGIIFTNREGKYRYKTVVEDNYLEKAIRVDDYSGDVPGIYFLRNLNIIPRLKTNEYSFENTVDLIDIINKETEDNKYQVLDIGDLGSSLIEYRDLDVYKKILKEKFSAKKNQTRFFNRLDVDKEKNVATKVAIDDKYNHLIRKEIEWYHLYDKLNTSTHRCAPQIYSNDDKSFKMEYLDGYLQLHEVLDDFEKNSEIKKIHDLYDNLMKEASECCNTTTLDVPDQVFYKDLHKELVDKVIQRCENIKGFLLNYRKEDLKKTLQNVYQKILDNLDDDVNYSKKNNTMKYYFCHGDLNGSNVMVNPKTLDIKFIDPRGYFGNTKMYGWKPYEIAKILYCLYGYDDFNIKPQVYLSDWPQIRQSLEYSGIRDLLSHKEYNMYVDMIGVIYVALAGYISQDIMKANIAYDFGMKLLMRNS